MSDRAYELGLPQGQGQALRADAPLGGPVRRGSGLVPHAALHPFSQLSSIAAARHSGSSAKPILDMLVGIPERST
jgi:hypothetical protein